MLEIRYGVTIIDNRGRGAIVEEYIVQYLACIINNGLPAHVHIQICTESTIDLSKVPPELVSDITWKVPERSKGSDHFPTKIKINEEDAVFKQQKSIFNKADWTLFRMLTLMGGQGEKVLDEIVRELTNKYKKRLMKISHRAKAVYNIDRCRGGQKNVLWPTTRERERCYSTKRRS